VISSREVDIMGNLWPLPIFLGVAVVLLVVYSVGSRFFTWTAPTQRTFWCPFRRTNVRVGFEESAWDGKLVDVGDCSAFAPPTEVYCDKACLDLKRLPAPRIEKASVPATRYWVW
jgi:hypothetical protein